MTFDNILKNGVEISSSGTTGSPKTIFRTPANLKACIDVAVSSQELTQRSSVLTVTRMTHAGGLLAQTLPAYSIGANFKIQQFNAFTFLKDFVDYTHTFLTPAHMLAITNTKGFVDCDLSGKRILTGSSPVTWEIIIAFVSRGATVQANWGMSEIGPITINITFNSLEKVYEYKSKIHNGTILGNTFYCDWKIENNMLLVKGPTSINNDWFNTMDQVTNFDGVLYYQGRRSATNALVH